MYKSKKLDKILGFYLGNEDLKLGKEVILGYVFLFGVFMVL